MASAQAGRRRASHRANGGHGIAIGLWLLVVPAVPVAAQDALIVEPGFDATGWIPAGAPFELRLSRALDPGEGRIAVFLGDADVTGLFRVAPDRLAYRGGPVRLASGEAEMVAYLVTGDTWQEIWRSPVRVRTAGGFEKAELKPSVVLNNQGQWAEGHAPDSNRPPREQFQDFTTSIGLQSTHERDGWSVRLQSNLSGVSNRQAALRFGEKQDAAPRLDLSDYRLTIERPGASLSAGNVSFDAERHLASGFASRGIVGTYRFGGAADLSLAAMNGTSIVGWSNPFGVSNPDHRVLGAALGIEVAPRRPGLARLELSAVNGSTRPLTGFTQGIVNDAERSRGAAVRVAAATPSQRARLDAGLAWSRFDNPADPELARGETLVPVRETARRARYLDVSADLVRNALILPTLPLSVGLGWRHEQVDPLFRTVTLPGVRADQRQNTIDLTATAGALAVQASLGRARDNLDGIPTILRTDTRNGGVTAAAALGQLFGRPSAWLPQFTWAVQRVHQTGSVSEAGSVPDTYVPDQVSTNTTLGLQWQGLGWRAGWQHNRSFQDNRQAEREHADFEARVDGLSVSLTPGSAFDVSVEVAQESARNLELSQTARTRRLAASANWRPWSSSQLGLSLSLNRLKDEASENEQRDTELRLEASRRFVLLPGPTRAPAQLFARFTRGFGDRIGPGPGRDSRRSWSLASGFSINLF